MPEVTIMWDAGHGGFDPGAVGPRGTEEKDITLAVAKKAAAFLFGKVNNQFTRTTDKALSNTTERDLEARVRLASLFGANLFISIHCNSAANPSARGVETYALGPGGEGERLAKAVQSRLVSATGLSDRGVKFEQYYVLRKTTMPAILIELAFISNPKEEGYLADEAFQNVCAKAIAEAVKQHLGIKEVPAVAEPWKEQLMQWGRDNLKIDSTHKADEPAPKWFVLAVLQRVLEGLKNAKSES